MATTTAGVVGFAWGLLPLGRADPALPRPAQRHDLLLIPVIAARPVRVHAGVGDPRLARRTCSSATSATSCGTCCACGGYLSPGLYSLAALEAIRSFESNPRSHARRRLNPFAILFEVVPRRSIYGRRDGGRRTRRTSSRWRSLLAGEPRASSACAIVSSSALEPMFAKVL